MAIPSRLHVPARRIESARACAAAWQPPGGLPTVPTRSMLLNIAELLAEPSEDATTSLAQSGLRDPEFRCDTRGRLGQDGCPPKGVPRLVAKFDFDERQGAVQQRI